MLTKLEFTTHVARSNLLKIPFVVIYLCNVEQVETHHGPLFVEKGVIIPINMNQLPLYRNADWVSGLQPPSPITLIPPRQTTLWIHTTPYS